MPRGIHRAKTMAERCWRQSAYDLQAAKRLLHPGTWYAAANVAHQSTEKALKAAIGSSSLWRSGAHVGRKATATTRAASWPSTVIDDPLLRTYARLFLFGSRARGTAHPHNDYDLVAVSPAFRNSRRLDHAPDRFALWRAAGGATVGLDLHCYTPEEFRAECASLGFRGQAKRRGELLEIPSTDAA